MLVFALFPLFDPDHFKGGQEIHAFPVRYWPQTPTFDNYRYLFRISDFSIFSATAYGFPGGFCGR